MSDLDEVALSRWLDGALRSSGSLRAVHKFPDGQSNPTYRLECEGVDHVLRRKPFGELLPSAHAIEREFRLISALYPASFPVPAPIAFCDDASVIGAPFYVMEMVEGRNFRDATLAELPPAERRSLFDAMVDTLARLHALDHEALGLGDFGRTGNYIARQVARWTKQYRSAQTDDVAEVEALIEWLGRTVPEQGRAAIIHGDFRIDNLIYAPDSARISAVLDWELATIGDPLADFAYLAMHWIMPRDGRSGLLGVDLEAEELPSLDDVVARYCAASGIDTISDLHWYFAYNLFRLIGIIQGIKKRIADGNASNDQAAQVTGQLVPLARIAWAEARKAGTTE